MNERRPLLLDWHAPDCTCAGLETEDTDQQEEEVVRVHAGFYNDTVSQCGITYQQCGGGRRIIRRQRGGY